MGSGSIIKDVPIILLSYLITLAGVLYRRFSTLFHSLPSSLRALTTTSSSSKKNCTCSSASSSSSSLSSATTHTQKKKKKKKDDPSIPPMTLPHLNRIEKLSSRVIRVLGLNPGSHTLQGTNTYIVGTGPRRLLIDTGEGRPGYPALIAEALKEAGAEGLQAMLLTHHHYDHTGGVGQVREAFGNKLTAYKWLVDERKEEGRLMPLEDGQVIKTEGATLKTIYTPGHTNDHVAFWLEEENSLFSGDCVLGHGTTVFDELYSYMQSLHRLLDLAKEKELGTIYPGHGDILKKEQSTKSIETYIKHRLEREEQILEVLQSGGRKLTPLQIVHAVYEDLPRGVVMSAQFNVEHHLNKLQREGKVTSSFGFWQATKTTAT